MRYINSTSLDDFKRDMAKIGEDAETQRWWKVSNGCGRVTQKGGISRVGECSWQRRSQISPNRQHCPFELDHGVSLYIPHTELPFLVASFQLTDNMQSSFIPGAVGSASGPGWWSTGEEVFRFEA